MGNTFPKASSRRWVWSLALAIVAGAVMGWLAWPTFQEARYCRMVFSPDPQERAAIMAWLGESLAVHELHNSQSSVLTGDEAFRLHRFPQLQTKIIRRIAHDDAISETQFSEVVNLLRQTDQWTPDIIPPELWLCNVERLIGTAQLDSLHIALQDALAFPLLSERDHPEGVHAIWHALLQSGGESHFAMKVYLQLCNRYGPSVADLDLFEHALEHHDSIVRRMAWITLGLTDPTAGYSANLDSESNSSVREAMLWAAVATNPDQLQVLEMSTPLMQDRLSVLHWLTSYDVRSSVMPKSDVYKFSEDAVAVRWAHWRRSKQISLREFQEVVQSPVAKDGSAWAAVLLAERLLEKGDAEKLALDWLNQWDGDTNKAGALLAGLLGVHSEQLQILLHQQNNPATRQYARLANFMVNNDRIQMSNEDEQGSSDDRLFAWRLLQSSRQEMGNVGAAELDITLALLAGNDLDIRKWIFEKYANSETSEEVGVALLRYAWLIERFCPASYQTIAPLVWWDQSIAQLQWDIMQVSWWLDSTVDK